MQSYHLRPCKRPDAVLPRERIPRHSLGLRSRHGSIASFHGGVPSTSMESSAFLGVLDNCSRHCSTSHIHVVVLTPLTYIHVGNRSPYNRPASTSMDLGTPLGVWRKHRRIVGTIPAMQSCAMYSDAHGCANVAKTRMSKNGLALIRIFYFQSHP